MEFVQERITTLHDLTGTVPDAPADRAAVVVPMTEREYASLAAERTLRALEGVAPGRVVVALRAAPDRVAEFRSWLADFDLPLDVLWCTAPGVRELLADAGLDGDAGKGRDCWLALGVAAAEAPFVVCHDADARTYSAGDVPRLLAPVAGGTPFVKGYYSRVEDGRLYGRLFRLLYAPLVRALADRHDAAVVAYLGAFRYALAGEFAATADLVRRLRVERRFGLEVGMLGDVYAAVGAAGTAQVDLGRYEHEHRAVGGPTGLADMSRDVAAALLRIVEEHGVAPDYASLPAAYGDAADALVRGYAADAAHNGLAYDEAEERAQVEAYADAIAPPGADDRLPAWRDAPLDPADVLEAARRDLAAAG